MFDVETKWRISYTYKGNSRIDTVTDDTEQKMLATMSYLRRTTAYTIHSVEKLTIYSHTVSEVVDA